MSNKNLIFLLCLLCICIASQQTPTKKSTVNQPKKVRPLESTEGKDIAKETVKINMNDNATEVPKKRKK